MLHHRMLTWDQVREMHQAGIEFGSHTVSHTILSCIPKPAMMKELQDSKNEISERLGCPVVTFAYPNGKHADYQRRSEGGSSRMRIFLRSNVLFRFQSCVFGCIRTEARSAVAKGDRRVSV